MATIDNYYDDIKKMLIDFKKKGYFSVFNSKDIFLNIFCNKKNPIPHLVTFIESFFGDSYGIQLFYNQDGLNYVHDIFTTTSDVVNVGDCDSLVAVFTPKHELNIEAKGYLKKMGKRIGEYNLVVYRFEKGYGRRVANKTELAVVSNELAVLSSILNNDYDDIVANFNDEVAAITFVDEEKFEYTIRYKDIPILEKYPSKSKADTVFVDEVKDLPYRNEECYLFASYLPFVIRESNVRPMLISYLMPDSDKLVFRFISDSKKYYKSCLLAILDEMFEEYNKPVKLFINNRDVYSLLAKTLDMLSIEYEFMREASDVDSSANNIIGQLYNSISDGYIQSKEELNSLMNTITNALNSLDEDDFSEYDLDEDDSDDTSSKSVFDDDDFNGGLVS